MWGLPSQRSGTREQKQRRRFLGGADDDDCCLQPAKGREAGSGWTGDTFRRAREFLFFLCFLSLFSWGSVGCCGSAM